jgi:dolichol kinase
MSDPVWSALWIVVLAAGIGGCMLAHRLGLASTYARDLLHIGTGIWVLGWPLWNGRAAPLALVFSIALATAAVPLLASRSRAASRLQHTFAGGDERWGGLVLYTAAYAIFSAIGLAGPAFPAAAALLALSLGDGIGGAVGRRFGRHRFQAPGGKPKSWEGSAAVAVASGLAIGIAAWRFEAPVAVPTVAGLGLGAALAEALSPRGTDNLIVPAAVWALAELVT